MKIRQEKDENKSQHEKKEKLLFQSNIARHLWKLFSNSNVFFSATKLLVIFFYLTQQQHTKHKQQYNGIKDKLETHYLEKKAINKRFPERLAPYISPHTVRFSGKASTQLLHRNKIGFSSFLLP